jgi:hypothetical protein
MASKQPSFQAEMLEVLTFSQDEASPSCQDEPFGRWDKTMQGRYNS